VNENSETQKLQFLRDEYQLLQNQYEDFDKRSLTIKGWIAAATIAAFALGLDESKHPPKEIWLVISAVVACVWYLEGQWKMFQYGLRDRIRILEAHFRNDPDILIKDPPPFQIYYWWFQSHRHDKPIYAYEESRRPRGYWSRLGTAMGQTFVFLPYFPIIVICMCFYFLR
jgi:hypothetical protein